MPATSAVDALLIVFEALPEDERDEAFERLAERRLGQLAAEESDTARMLRSLRDAAEEIERIPPPPKSARSRR